MKIIVMASELTLELTLLRAQGLVNYVLALKKFCSVLRKDGK